MIQVSNEFKSAIKKAKRKIKGYVEVLYDLPSVEATATTGITSTYTDISEVVNGKRVSNNYGTLDYLPLDGSVLTMDTSNNENSGFISNNLAGEIDYADDKITLSFSETTINGLTIYYEDNFPEVVNYTFSDGTTATSGGSSIDQIIFETPKTLTGIVIQYNLWRYEQRKIRINQIDLGITEVYKDKDLIDFTIDEEVNKLVEEVPTNETNITLNNMSDLFNPLNPTGIVPYLSENTLIKPYIGVLTKNLGVEYVKMGEFYFDSYTNNSDSTTTLVGKNMMKKLMGELLNNDNETEFFYGLGKNKTKFLQYMANYNYVLNEVDWAREIGFFEVKSDKLIDLLKDSAFLENDILYFDRDNKFNIRQINNTAVDSLTKNELIIDVEYKKIDKINTINNSFEYDYVKETVASKQVLETNVTLTKSPQIFLVNTNSALGISSVVQTGGTGASIIDFSSFIYFVKVTGTIGSIVTLQFYSTAQMSSEKVSSIMKSSETENPSIIEFNSPLLWLADTPQNKFDFFPSYEMRFDYNGDPSLEAGDYINVETPYGYKKLFIQKNRFKFDGGLEGSIEGVE